MRRPWVEKGGRRKKKECFSNASECNFANLRLFVKSKNFVVFSQNEFLQTDVFNYVWIDEINCLTVACAFSRQNEFVSFWPPFLILQCCHIDGRRPAVAFQQAPCCAGANRVPVRSGSRRGKPGAGLLMQFLAHCTFRHNPPRNRPAFVAPLPRSVRPKRELRWLWSRRRLFCIRTLISRSCQRPSSF